jgi:hypothetical protein
MGIYDSTEDTLKHKERVKELMNAFIVQLQLRAENHDNSKLEEPEKSVLDHMTPKLKDLVYGSEEYKSNMGDLEEILEHHYKTNSHHPEFHDNGINGFDLGDLVEAFFDWVSAAERTKGGNIYDSIDICKTKFHMSGQLALILYNTATNLKL